MDTDKLKYEVRPLAPFEGQDVSFDFLEEFEDSNALIKINGAVQLITYKEDVCAELIQIDSNDPLSLDKYHDCLSQQAEVKTDSICPLNYLRRIIDGLTVCEVCEQGSLFKNG